MSSAIVELCCEFRYEAAHQLPNVPDGHKCGRMHGHSYRLTVTVRGTVGQDGFVTDFADIKSAVDPVIKTLDHQPLNAISGLENPTVENQLVWLWEALSGIGGLCRLKLRETANHSAIYSGELL